MLPAETAAADMADQAHMPLLDGWRGISILLVLATHMLPVGPKWLELNGATGLVGMSLFFILSGFLITSSLLRHPAPGPFLIKRLFRILPLSWAFILIVIAPQAMSMSVIAANLLFYSNSSEDFLRYAPHFWSLCIEVQFYLFAALLVGVGGRRSLALLPVLGILISLARVVRGETMGVGTFDRVDEILAGTLLAIALANGWRPPALLARPSVIMLLIAILFIGGQPDVMAVSPIPAYCRPYLAASAIGLSLFLKDGWLTQMLSSRPLAYIARISFALYVIHPVTMSGWLTSGDTAIRYLKRPLCIAIAFAAAHISTLYFERPLNRLGHRLAASRRTAQPLSGHMPS